jgi:hypothetical protein
MGMARRAFHGVPALVLGGLLAIACDRANRPAAQYPEAPPPRAMITKDEPPPYCQFRGAVTSRQKPEFAYDDLQQQGGAIGATHVVLDGTRAAGITWGYRIKNELFGRAYWCPPPPAYAPAPPPGYYAAPPQVPVAAAPPYAAQPPAPGLQPAGAPACAPACQAGYTCVGQACVPVCDPPCAAGLVCATDRVCRAR